MTLPSDKSFSDAPAFPPQPIAERRAAAEGSEDAPPGEASGSAPGRASSPLMRSVAIGLVAALVGGVLGYVVKRPPEDETRFVNFDPESAPPTVLVGGWSSFEVSQPSLDTFVWCAGSSCRLRLVSRAEGDRVIRARLSPFRYPDAPPQTVTAYLNETQIGTKPVPDGMSIVSFRAARSAWKAGPNELRFEFAYAESPKSKIAGMEDTRKLSAGFDWLDITAP